MSLPNGYVVPEKAAAKNGAKRVRAQRQRGFMIIMTHKQGLNKMAFSKEAKKARFTLALSFVLRGSPVREWGHAPRRPARPQL